MYNEEQFLYELENLKSISRYAWCFVLQEQIPHYQKILNDTFFHNKTFCISYYETSNHSPLFIIEAYRDTFTYSLFLYQFYRRIQERRLLPQECISIVHHSTHFFIGA